MRWLRRVQELITCTSRNTNAVQQIDPAGLAEFTDVVLLEVTVTLDALSGTRQQTQRAAAQRKSTTWEFLVTLQ
jgi:hypothetical protein